MPLLLILVYAVVQAIAFAVLPERDAEGAVTRSGVVEIDGLRVGDCFNWIDIGGGSARQIELQPCDRPHDARAVGQTLYPARSDAVWPGGEELSGYAKEHCGRIVAADHQMATITPSDESWRDGDRTVVCVQLG